MKYVFYVTESGFRAYVKGRKQPEYLQEFVWDEPAEIEFFISELSAKSEVMIVLDLIEEDLFFEWIPKVMPWEKSALLKLRKSRLVGEKIALSEVQSTHQFRKSDGGRKEELILSATISDAFKLTSFLNSLEAAQIELRGIYSKPFLLKSFFQQQVKPSLGLSKEQENLSFLIISRQSEREFRQTFFHENEMRLSRPVQIETEFETEAEIHNELLEETKLAITYVYNQKIIPFNAPIGLIFLDSDPTAIRNLEQLCIDKGVIRAGWDQTGFYFASSSFKDISNSPLCQNRACYSEQAVVDFLFNHKLSGFYHTPYITRLNNFQVSRKGLSVLNLGLFIGALTFVLINSVDNFLSWQKLGMLDSHIVAHQNEKKRLTELVKLQDDAKQIKDSVEFSEAVLTLRVDRLIGFDIQSFSEVLQRHPNIQLKEIDWKNLKQLDSRLHEINISGWVYPFYDTYKKPVYWVDALVKDLQTLVGIESVNLTEEPLNRNLREATRIDVDKGSEESLPFKITLRVQDGQSK